MNDVAGDAMRATQVGSRGVMKPPADDAASVAAFQTVVLAADRLSGEGLISINQKHRESMTGLRNVVRVVFTRLR